ncbi:MAG TPA: o-succinylbenzoate synthase [Terriglobia bacterium]|jgi:O-succinylbenzoate synthase|nr:o-succinylbenzoate synthase [Terriglobia bacterium]
MPTTIDFSEIRLHWVQVPLHEPFKISNGEVSIKDAILVEMRSSDGCSGWGEASPMGGSFYSSETPETTWDFLVRKAIPALLATPVPAPEECFEWLSEFPGEPFAKAGVEGAVWDFWANRKAAPLYRMLGGRARPVPSGAAIGLMPTAGDLLARVETFLKDGYRRIKIKIMPGHDVELVRAIRGRFGDIPLMVDANAAYCMDDAAVFEELDAYGLIMIEQPLGRKELEEHAELQRRLRTPVCLDESAEDLEAINHIIRLGSAKIINIKVQRMGGLAPAKQAHDQARAAGIPCWAGTMPELGVASAQALHLATLDNFTFPTDVEASSRWFKDDIIVPPIEIDGDGFICLPEGPGTGWQVDKEKVARYRIRCEEFKA